MTFEIESRPSVPEEQFGFAEWVVEEFSRIIERLNTGQEFLILSETHVVPGKPRNGEVRFADGTNWNPGAGRGFYGYDGTSWNKF